ncbi:MAG: hypothetical protein H7X89_14045 [Rhizobiales bacterium]|nr:hypothetical protein [Hyphomicrobiales bacterium]
MLTQWNNVLWSAIGLLFQLVLVMVLVALLMGEAAGGVVNTVYGNVRELLATLNPATVAVAAVLYLFWRMHSARVAGPSA